MTSLSPLNLSWKLSSCSGHSTSIVSLNLLEKLNIFIGDDMKSRDAIFHGEFSVETELELRSRFVNFPLKFSGAFVASCNVTGYGFRSLHFFPFL